jgi:hypothetical protein
VKPKAFTVTIPVKSFSKHDYPRHVANVIRRNIQNLLHSFQKLAGVEIFDVEKVTVEPVYEVVEAPKPSSTKKKV